MLFLPSQEDKGIGLTKSLKELYCTDNYLGGSARRISNYKWW